MAQGGGRGQLPAGRGDLLGGALGHELAARLAALGTQVEHPAGRVGTNDVPTLR